MNPNEETFELCWTDYYAESGFDKIERGEHLKPRDDIGNQDIKSDVGDQFMQNQPNLAQDLTIERNLNEITLANTTNVHLTIFGAYEHSHEDKEIKFSPTHLCNPFYPSKLCDLDTNSEEELITSEDLKKGFRGIFRQSSGKEKGMMLRLDVPLKINDSFKLLDCKT